MNSAFKIIEQAASEKWINPLALFHLFKYQFRNSVIYNYRSRMNELANHYCISTKTLYKYLSIWKEKGLIENKGNRDNLHLISISSMKQALQDKKKCSIEITQRDNLHTISIKIYAKIIENHLKKMAFSRAIKEYGRRDPHKMRVGETASILFSLSERNTAKLLNISKNKAVKVIKTLEELKIIKLHQQKAIKLSKNKLNLKVIDDFPGYKFITKNGTFVQFGSKIELLQYPVKIPKISRKVYLNHYHST